MTARTLVVDSGAVTRLTKRWFAIDSGAVARLAKRVFVIDSGAVARLIFANQVIATATPTNCFASTPTSGTITTNSTTASATGGIPPYTYSWTLTGASGPTITITSPSTASTAFTAHIPVGQTALAEGVCTVTDSIGDQGQAFVTVELTSLA